jgi:iron complex outermembrane receptor protein
LVEFGPRRAQDDSNSINLASGLRGNIGKFEWDFGVQYARQRLTSRRSGFAKKDALGALIHGTDTDGDGIGEGGTLNLFEPIPPSVVDQVAAHPSTHGRSTITSADFQVTGNLFDLWGGRSVGFASVLEYAKQSFKDERDADTLAGNVVSLGGTSGGGDRKYSALGLEFEVPVLEQVVVNLAGRYDHYDDESDVGGAFSPRIAIEYRPLPAVLLRGSAGRSFRAPDMQRLFGATTLAFLDLVDTPKCIQDGGTGRGDPTVPTCTQSAQSIRISTGANRELKEERGENYSVGIVWEIMRQLTVSLDVFRIDLKDVVNTPEEQLILDKNAADGSFADAINRNVLIASPQNPGGLDLVSSQARNLSFQKMTGLDAESRYTVSSGFGDWSFEVGATYLDRLIIQEAEGEPEINVLADGIVGEFVRFKGHASIGWRRNAFAATVFVNYIGGFTPINTASIDRVGSWTTTNVSGTWDAPWNGTVQVGVNNVFDRDPPLDLQDGDAGQPFYNRSFHNALGANWFVNYAQRF